MEETPQPFTITAVSLRYGLIYGVINIIYFLIVSLMEISPTPGISFLIGLVMAGAVFYFEAKFYLENGDGYMNYSQGIGLGVLAGLIGGLLSGIFSFIYTKFIDPNVIQMARDKAVEQMQAQGQSDEQIEMGMKFVEMFTSPPVYLIMSIIFGVIMMLVVSLIISIFTQKQRPETI